MTHRAVLLAQILWPSFMTAAMLELLVFSVVDPTHLSVGAWQPTPTAVYSLGFLLFWVITSSGMALSHWMRMAPREATSSRRAKRLKRQSTVAGHAHS